MICWHTENYPFYFFSFFFRTQKQNRLRFGFIEILSLVEALSFFYYTFSYFIRSYAYVFVAHIHRKYLLFEWHTKHILILKKIQFISVPTKVERQKLNKFFEFNVIITCCIWICFPSTDEFGLELNLNWLENAADAQESPIGRYRLLSETDIDTVFTHDPHNNSLVQA